MSGAGSDMRAVVGLAVLGLATALIACSPSETPSASSSVSHPGVVTTLPGVETCENRTLPNDESPELYRERYAKGLATTLKNKLNDYDSAVDASDSQRIGESGLALATEVRVDVKLVTEFPRLYGCYDRTVLNTLKGATEAFGTALDALSCSGADACRKIQAEIPTLVWRVKPQERSYVVAINAYAAQFGGEQLPMPRTTAGFKMRL